MRLGGLSPFKSGTGLLTLTLIGHSSSRRIVFSAPAQKTSLRLCSPHVSPRHLWTKSLALQALFLQPSPGWETLCSPAQPTKQGDTPLWLCQGRKKKQRPVLSHCAAAEARIQASSEIRNCGSCIPQTRSDPAPELFFSSVPWMLPEDMDPFFGVLFWGGKGKRINHSTPFWVF